MKSLFINNEQCFGCTACKSVCPNKAISMIPDREGFLYPRIDQGLCTDCGVCEKVCAFNKQYNNNEKLAEPDIYAAKHKDEDIRAKSTSGGAFSAMSDYVLSLGGTIYGAGFDDKLYIHHYRAKTKEERNGFRGSKYVQSDLMSTFIEVEADLRANLHVLFSGTPCQTDGLRNYLQNRNIDRSRLFLCDLVCHGVPSPLMWKEYLKLIETKKGTSVVKFEFRPKILKGGNILNHAFFSNGKQDYRSLLSQVHMYLFLRSYILRPSCYVCPYTNFERPSDITVADFWGIERTMREFQDRKGISLVLVNTHRGRELFNSIKNNLNIKTSNKRDCLQHSLEKPSIPPPKKSQFWADYYDKGYEYVARKYGKYGIRGCGHKMFNMVKPFIKAVLGRV